MNVKDSFNWEKIKKKDPCWERYDSLEDAIKGCTDLGKLFDLWQTAQIYETDVESSFPNLSLAKCPELSPSEFKHSFCADGFLAKDGKAGVPVLFICRESNISSCIKEDHEKRTTEIVGNIGQDKGDEPLFWLREVVRCKEKDRSDYFPGKNSPGTAEKTAQTKYFNCLSQVLKYLKVDTELSNCAYLNINKRGGFASCDQSRLAVYAERYQMFIQKEIRIIQPEHIVICGELNNGALRKAMESILQACDYHEYWVYPKHPSRYTKKTFENTDKKTII